MAHKQKSKNLRYRHVRNLRDLGGLYNFGSLKIKKGLIFRSSYLGKMSLEESDKFVEKYNVGTVIDLRTPDEVSINPDIKSKKVNYVHYPVLRNEDNPATTKENRKGILFHILNDEGGVKPYLASKYRKMVTDEYSLEYFRKIFDILLDETSNKSVVYHCTQGKDRTGVTSALILLALGVEEKNVITDYMLFNTPYRLRNALISFVVYLRYYSLKISHALYFLQMANKYLIKSAFDEIHKVYGTIDNFLLTALNLDGEKINKLKNKYLVK